MFWRRKRQERGLEREVEELRSRVELYERVLTSVRLFQKSVDSAQDISKMKSIEVYIQDIKTSMEEVYYGKGKRP
ncbi:MAG: hypothetical protein NZ526_03395 [Aquificaceae bacterium]|nr:hypothetical protein [Aquificaceae bacterium]